jgi:GNAT superfamily N-acetyltransferase
MLNLRTVRGPLQGAEEESILADYNRLTGARIPLGDFRRWVRDSPEGPAWHAILQTDEARIVGHFSLIPLRAHDGGKDLIAAKTEYFFVHEDFRREKVRGFENSILSCAILLLSQLYEECRASGWGPVLVSANDQIERFHRAVGCRPVPFKLSECLLILRPWAAAQRTPNLTTKQRAAMLFVGIAQRMVRSVTSVLASRSRGVGFTSVDSVCVHRKKDQIAFFEDRASLIWRYPSEDYVTVASDSDPHQFVIAKHGSDERFLRVCQWELAGSEDPAAFLLALIDQARREKALGVRWSLYREQQQPELLGALRKLGFLCVQRERRLLFYTSDKKLLNPEKWCLTDSFFAFDL